MLREALTPDRLQAMTPDEAAASFVLRSADGLSASEQDLLAGWIAEDRTHALAFERAQGTWHTFDNAEGDEILAAMRSHALTARPLRWLQQRYAFAAAGMVVLLVAASMLVSPLRQIFLGPAGSGANPATWTRYAMGHGEVRTIRLPDGSTMTLDTDTTALARFAGNERAIRVMQGRVLFEVAKDPARPFAVTAAARRVVALGTRFEIDTDRGALSVALFRGKVVVQPLAAGGQVVTLDPGQRFFEKNGAFTVEALGAGTTDRAPWQSGLLEFDDTPLGDAARQVNRYSRTRIVISDPRVASIRVSGQFRAGDAERFARTLAEVYSVRPVRRGDAIELVSTK